MNASGVRCSLWWVTLIGITLVFAVGCGGEPGATNPTAASNPGAPNRVTVSSNSQTTAAAPRETPGDEGPVLHLPYAQPKLPTTRLRIGAFEMEAEVCRTQTQIATGLMFRNGIGPDEGMLFLFSRPHQPAFYMKNVSFDIDVAYIGPDGVINEIVRLKAMDRTAVPSKSDHVQFVLEAAPDYFSKRNLGPGTLVMTAKGGLKETFLGR
jgi:uncharacterized protein